MNVYAKPTAGYQYRDKNQPLPEVLGQRTILNARDLSQHKHREHYDELQKIAATRRGAEKVKFDRETAAHKRSQVARETAGDYWIVFKPRHSYREQLTVKKAYEAEEDSIILGMTFRPEPEGFSYYNALLAKIEELKEEALGVLKRAWEAGDPMTQQDLFQIRQASEKAYREEPTS